MSAEVIQLNEHRPKPRTRKPRQKRSPQRREQARQEERRPLTAHEWRQAFSGRLKYVRAQLGITEKVAATAFGIMLKTYHKYEAGQHDGNVAAMDRFCEIYGVSITWLIVGDGPPPRFRLRAV
jgi:ribosome-binding protein aMBF1 (putative translation factor)